MSIFAEVDDEADNKDAVEMVEVGADAVEERNYLAVVAIPKMTEKRRLQQLLKRKRLPWLRRRLRQPRQRREAFRYCL